MTDCNIDLRSHLATIVALVLWKLSCTCLATIVAVRSTAQIEDLLAYSKNQSNKFDHDFFEFH